MDKEFTPAEKIRIAAAILREMGVTHAYIKDKEIFVVEGDDFKAIIGDMPVQTHDRRLDERPFDYTEYSVELPDGWKLYTLDYEEE